MPRTIVTEDGDTIEVPTDEELQALKDSASKVEELSKKAKDLEDFKTKIESDPIEKNWNALRTKTERMAAELSKQGKTVNDDGTIIDAPKSLSVEEIESKARAAARSEMVGERKRNLLSRYDEETRKVVEHYFNKLSSGDEVGVDNIEKYISEAERLAMPNSAPAMRTPHSYGQAPVLHGKNGDSFSDSELGKSLAKEMFGEESFTNKK